MVCDTESDSEVFLDFIESHDGIGEGARPTLGEISRTFFLRFQEALLDCRYDVFGFDAIERDSIAPVEQWVRFRSGTQSYRAGKEDNCCNFHRDSWIQVSITYSERHASVTTAGNVGYIIVLIFM
jgi:hypothetical protein